MRRKWWLFLVAPPAIVLFVWLFGEAVMHLWNWLLPTLFGWHTITFWQGLGLLVLCRILFGGFGNGGSGGGRKGRPGSRVCWERMTPEEREKFHEWRHSHAGRGPGSSGTPTGESA